MATSSSSGPMSLTIDSRSYIAGQTVTGMIELRFPQILEDGVEEVTAVIRGGISVYVTSLYLGHLVCLPRLAKDMTKKGTATIRRNRRSRSFGTTYLSGEKGRYILNLVRTCSSGISHTACPPPSHLRFMSAMVPSRTPSRLAGANLV
jgi:hypothetical protein